MERECAMYSCHSHSRRDAERLVLSGVGPESYSHLQAVLSTPVGKWTQCLKFQTARPTYSDDWARPQI